MFIIINDDGMFVNKYGRFTHLWEKAERFSQRDATYLQGKFLKKHNVRVVPISHIVTLSGEVSCVNERLAISCTSQGMF